MVGSGIPSLSPLYVRGLSLQQNAMELLPIVTA